MSNIQEPLKKIFNSHRIVFWYDTDKELRGDYEALDLPDVIKIELDNNEFGIKHRILREEPKAKFLLYHEGPQPADLDNWLLDVLLAHGEFHTDQAALFLTELELGIEFADLVRAHLDFFGAAKRREALKKLLKPDDTPGLIRLKILAVCAGADPRIDSILENLLAELSEDRDEKIKLIRRCGLDAFLWEQLQRFYGYESETPAVLDFTIELFKSCYQMEFSPDFSLNNEALVFLKRWKDSIRHKAAFESLSDRCADILNIKSDLQQRDMDTLVEIDYFRFIDQKIISDLVKKVAGRTVTAGECAAIVRGRRQSHWYQDYIHLYEAVDHAARFIYELAAVKLQVDSIVSGVERYAASWFRLDQLYRKFVYHTGKSGQVSLLGQLANTIEDLYTNKYLLLINDKWQEIVDGCQNWNAGHLARQDKFYQRWVSPFLKDRKKVAVIISDAMRFEIGVELLGIIRKEDRYEAEIEPMLTMLPSYTQLGMAALLPNEELQFGDNNVASVVVDGTSSQGTANRGKILSQAIKARGAALRSEDLLIMNKDECRALFRDNDVVYIYHNRIDATGDDRKTEERVFEAAEDGLQELLKIIKKLTAANFTNMLVTADHGFIYQHRPIEESDFAGVTADGQEVLHRDRRFVLGRGLTEHASLKKFTAKELGLVGDIEIQIPKSINRLRLKGSGSRFVHGGASLQEVVVPVIRVNKKKQTDTSNVEVEILRSGGSTITSGQLAVAFYQIEPVTSKRQPRILRAGIYDNNGELVSDSHELVFDFVSDNPRERELKVRFVMSRKADEVNNQDVLLKLEEQVSGTSQYREYKILQYSMRRSFTSDFEF